MVVTIFETSTFVLIPGIPYSEVQQGASLLATSLHTLRRRMVDLQAELEATRARVVATRSALTKAESELATTREALDQVSARERNAQQLLSRFRGRAAAQRDGSAYL